VSAPSTLVTGAAGFIGASLVRRLLEQGGRVTAVVRPGGDHWRLDGLDGELEVAAADVADGGALRAVWAQAKPVRAFHLAAHGGYSWQTDAARIRAANADGTRAVLTAAADFGCSSLVVTGSSSEYGRQDHAPTESETPGPEGPYAETKLEATRMCEQAGRDGLPVVVLRLYSAYGPFEDPRRLMPRLAAHALRGELPALAQPDTARDFVWVGDVIDALTAAAERAPGVAGGVFNIGSGRQTTLAELVEITRATLGIEAVPAWETMAARDWDTEVWVADPRRARDELGWRASVPLEEGLSLLAQWLRKNRGLWKRYGVSAVTSAPAR
jgi:dolichol-phosphate mannosyltransferase